MRVVLPLRAVDDGRPRQWPMPLRGPNKTCVGCASNVGFRGHRTSAATSQGQQCAITGREQMQQRPCVSERQSLDHLIGALLEYPRHIEAKRLGGLEIKH